MLGFLMRDEDLEIIKVTFAVVAPWAIKGLLEGEATFFDHCSVSRIRAIGNRIGAIGKLERCCGVVKQGRLAVS
jgi:hypothetical protein